MSDKAADTLSPTDLERRLNLETTLRELTNRIHQSTLDEILVLVRNDIQRMLNASRVTLYVKDSLKNEIYSKVKDGKDLREIRVPIRTNSIAGFVAKKQKLVRLANAYDEGERIKVDKELAFDSSWDQKSGFLTKQVLAAPIMSNGRLHGVIQVVNRPTAEAFNEEDERICRELAQTLAIAFSNQKRLTMRRSKYDLLLDAEKVNEEMLEEAAKTAKTNDCSVEKVLMEKHKISKEELGASLEHFFRCKFQPFTHEIPVPMKLLENFTVDYLKHHQVVPLTEDEKQVLVLMANPKDIVTRDDLSSRLGGRRVDVAIGFREDILQFIDFYYGQTDSGKEEGKGATKEELSALINEVDSEFAETDKKKEGATEEEEEAKEDDSGIVRLVNQIIEAGFAQGASDIHMEPYPEDDMMVRFRIDGVCREYTQLPKRFSRAVSSRIKIMSGLDIAERRLPQDGKIKFKNYGKLDIELRVAVIPTVANQEDVVMRILASSKPIPLDNIGMIPPNLERFKVVIDQPYGILLCVGPTGSGKTTTLHSALGHINKPEWKIWTAEDPVEITQKGLRQVQIHHKIGYTFERALRAFLRADPDMIMVGEMRDRETAGAGIEASLTGHVVFSTLHTNSAPETITRLLDMDIDPFSFGDSLLGILAQRLCRTLCKNCKEEYLPDEKEWQELKDEFGSAEAWKRVGLPDKPANMRRPKGCDKCGTTGYKGRVGLHELLVVDDDLRSLIFQRAKVETMRNMAIDKGMFTLKQDGIYKVVQGLTSLREVRSVCSR